MGYIYPDCDLRRWEYCDNSVILANADDYYTKKEVEDLIDDVSGMSPSEVQNMINDSIRTKADKSEVNELATQVSANTEAISNRYTKAETNALLASYKSKIEAARDIAEYARIDGEVLTLNANNIGI